MSPRTREDSPAGPWCPFKVHSRPSFQQCQDPHKQTPEWPPSVGLCACPPRRACSPSSRGQSRGVGVLPCSLRPRRGGAAVRSVVLPDPSERALPTGLPYLTSLREPSFCGPWPEPPSPPLPLPSTDLAPDRGRDRTPQTGASPAKSSARLQALVLLRHRQDFASLF